MPIAARKRAAAPKIENIHDRRSEAHDRPSRFSSPVRASKTARRGSDWPIAFRTAGVIEAGGTPVTRIVRPAQAGRGPDKEESPAASHRTVRAAKPGLRSTPLAASERPG
jgi:hypothetical protein